MLPKEMGIGFYLSLFSLWSSSLHLFLSAKYPEREKLRSSRIWKPLTGPCFLPGVAWLKGSNPIPSLSLRLEGLVCAIPKELISVSAGSELQWRATAPLKSQVGRSH